MAASGVAPTASTADHPNSGLRCSHCGQGPSETVHTQSGYRVGHYRLELGFGRPAMVTCARCYERAEIRAERDRYWATS